MVCSACSRATGLPLEALTRRSTSSNGAVKTGTSWTSEGAYFGYLVRGDMERVRFNSRPR